MMKTTNNVADDFSCAPSIILKFNNHMLFYSFEMTRKKMVNTSYTMLFTYNIIYNKIFIAQT